MQPSSLTFAELPNEMKLIQNPVICCSYLLLSISNGCEPVNRLWVCDLRQLPSRPGNRALDLSSFDISTGQEKLPLQKFIDSFEASFTYVANTGSELILHTNLQAPRYR